jgi:hypothetical protein
VRSGICALEVDQLIGDERYRSYREKDRYETDQHLDKRFGECECQRRQFNAHSQPLV